ncbi:MAG TPA: hypothetical protein VFH78_10165 [Candidatus Thermoplasmatota archaeon]|nr:hypothetical protein [Candidatus Thermoplasmatota archaeon]
MVSRLLYWLGLVLTLGAIAVVLYGAMRSSLPVIGAGFLLGLIGIGVTARGATLTRF